MPLRSLSWVPKLYYTLAIGIAWPRAESIAVWLGLWLVPPLLPWCLGPCSPLLSATLPDRVFRKLEGHRPRLALAREGGSRACFVLDRFKLPICRQSHRGKSEPDGKQSSNVQTNPSAVLLTGPGSSTAGSIEAKEQIDSLGHEIPWRSGGSRFVQ